MLKSNTKPIKEEEKKNPVHLRSRLLKIRGCQKAFCSVFVFTASHSLLGAKQPPYISTKFIYLFGHFPQLWNNVLEELDYARQWDWNHPIARQKGR